MAGRIEERARFDFVRYANCWEDAGVLSQALPHGPDDRILSIASAGDNSLALLEDGAEVVAADLSQAQLACVELRCATFRRLDYEEVLGFLGVRPASGRVRTYQRIRSDLTAASRAFWDAHPDDVTAGIIHRGKFEDYFRKFRTVVLPLIHRGRTVQRLLEDQPEEARLRFYAGTWDSARWRILFKVFFSRVLMGRLGRDPEFFRFVEGSVADRILARTRHALTRLPTHSNPYLEYILTGRFSRSLPRYLEPARFRAIRAHLDRLTLFHGPVHEAARAHGERKFSGFNLSDIFEYLDMDRCAEVYAVLLDHARPAARLAYWNMLVPRRRPDHLSDRVTFQADLSQRLLQQDRAFFYSAFVVEEFKT